MKTLLPLLFFILAATLAYAQTERFVYPDAFYFVKEVSLHAQGGKAFHFDISARENPADSLSRPRIYAIQARKGKDNFIGNTLTYAKVANGNWNTYSIDGIVDKQATRVWLYVAVNGNGDFYFDNLHFLLADTSGALKEKALTNASFEEKKILAGYYISKPFSNELKISISPIASDGKQSLRVSSTGEKPAVYHSFASN